MIQIPATKDESRLLQAWLEHRVPNLDCGESAFCLGVWRDEKLAAVAAFYNFRRVDVEMSFASDNPRWATKQTIAWILAYPFLQLETQRVTAMVQKSNKRCRKLLRGAGFMEEGRHRHAGPQLETMFSYGMTRQDYMDRYGQKVTASAATGT